MRLIKFTIFLVALMCAFGRASAAHDPEVAHWFERHSEASWQPLAERWREVKESMSTPVENLTLPLDYYANGKIKTRLRAERAQLFLDGTIFALQVVVEMLTVEGGVEGLLTAEDCLYDRAAKHGYCRGAVGVSRDSDRISGRGMYFSVEEQFIKILAECEIRTKRIKNSFGRIQ